MQFNCKSVFQWRSRRGLCMVCTAPWIKRFFLLRIRIMFSHRKIPYSQLFFPSFNGLFWEFLKVNCFYRTVPVTVFFLNFPVGNLAKIMLKLMISKTIFPKRNFWKSPIFPILNCFFRKMPYCQKVSLKISVIHKLIPANSRKSGLR